MITFNTQNLRRLCMNAGITALLVAGGANAHVVAGGYEPDSCTPHALIVDAACSGTFSQCQCTYVPEGGTAVVFSPGTAQVDCMYIPEGGTTPLPCTACPGVASKPIPEPGTYYYHRLTACGLGNGPTWPDPPYSPRFAAQPGEPSCGHIVVKAHSPPLPPPEPHSTLGPYVVTEDPPDPPVYYGPEAHVYDWTHDSCPLPLVTKTQAMNGDLKVAQGSILRAGFDFTMPGSHPSATVGFVGTGVVFNATCASGTAGSAMIIVRIPDQFYDVPAGSSAWYPSGDQNNAATYQSSVTVPHFCDPGTLVRFQQGGTFSTAVQSTDKQNKVNVRWHYSDGTGGGWSGTYSVIGN